MAGSGGGGGSKEAVPGIERAAGSGGRVDWLEAGCGAGVTVSSWVASVAEVVAAVLGGGGSEGAS